MLGVAGGGDGPMGWRPAGSVGMASKAGVARAGADWARSWRIFQAVLRNPFKMWWISLVDPPTHESLSSIWAMSVAGRVWKWRSCVGVRVAAICCSKAALLVPSRAVW